MGVETVEKRKGSEDEDDWWESMMPKLPEPKKKKKRKTEKEGIRHEEEDWTEEEMKVMIEEVTKREEALFGDYKEDESPNNRWRLWLEVADKVNDVSIKHRNVEKVRIKWFEHKNPKHKFCNWKKSVLYKRISYRPVTKRRYWHMRRKLPEPLPVIDNVQSAKKSVTPPQPTTQQTLQTIVVETIQQTQKNYSTVLDDEFGPYGEPLRRDKSVSGPHGESLNSDKSKDGKDNASEDVIIIDEVASKNSNREYEVIVIDDENITNEGREPNISLQTASKKEEAITAKEYLARISDGKESSKMKQRMSEEERVKEWLMLTDEERKSRVKQILNNLKEPSKSTPPRGPVSSRKIVKTHEKPRTEHFIISMPQKAAIKFPTPSLENLKNTNLSSEKNAAKISGVPSVSPNESSSNATPSGSSDTNPSGSSDTNPSGSSDINPSGSRDTHPSGSSDTNPSGNSDTNPSVSRDSNPSGISEMNPSGSCDMSSSRSSNTNSPESNFGKITEVFSMASAEEFQNVPSSSSIVSKTSVLFQDKAVDKLTTQQPSSETRPLKFPATLSAPSTKISKDLSPVPRTEASHLIAIPQAPSVQNFLIVKPLTKNTSDVMTVVPVYQQVVPQTIVMPQIVGEQLIAAKEGEKANNANVKDSSSGSDSNSSKKIMSSSTSINAESEILREIFGVDAAGGNSTQICEKPAELVKTIKSHSTVSEVCMEGGNASEKSITSVSKKTETNVKHISNNNVGADTKKANNDGKVNVDVVSKGSSPKNNEQSTSAESIIDGLKQITERPTKVYSGKSALRKRVMHSVQGLSENDQKQTPQPSYYIDLTKEGSTVTKNPINPKFIEIKDSVSGKSFLTLQENLPNVQIQKDKSIICSQKGDRLNILFNPAANTQMMNEAHQLKQQLNMNHMQKPRMRPILPNMPQIHFIQRAICIPALQNIQISPQTPIQNPPQTPIQNPPQTPTHTPKRPILLRNNVSKPLTKPASLIMFPTGVPATTSGIQKKSEASLKPVTQPDTQQPVPVSIHKAGDASLKLIQQPRTEEAIPVAIHKVQDGPSTSPVASQKNENEAPVKDSSTTIVVSSGGRKRARKDLGIPRPTTIRKEPVVVLERL